jgi:hypothetical protein
MSRTKGSYSTTLSYLARRLPLGLGSGSEHADKAGRRERTRPPRPAACLSHDLAVAGTSIWLSDSERVYLIEDPQERAGAL